MQFLPRIKPVRQSFKEPYAVPERCKEILEKIRNENKPVLRLEKTDPSKIIYLLSTFSHRTAAGIEKQLNKYFMKELPTKCAFLTTFIDDEAQIRAIGTRKLKYPYRVFLGSNVVEELYIKSLSNTNGPLGPLHPELHRCFEELLIHTEGVITSIPIFPPEDSAIKFFLFSIIDPCDDIMFVMQFVSESFRYFLPTLTQTIIYDLELFNRIVTEATLNLIGTLYSIFTDLNEVVKIVLKHTIELTHSMDGCFYLIDPDDDLKARMFSTINDDIHIVYLRDYDGIVGRSARTGLSIIIKRNQEDLLEHDRHIKVKCMFSCPIFYKDQLVAVILLYNKRSGDYTYQDFLVLNMLEDTCGALISKCILYYNAKHLEEQCQFGYRMLTHYFKFDDASVEQILSCTHNNYMDMDFFEFDPREVMLCDMCGFVMKIFENFNLLGRFKIDRKKFAKFILHVKFAFHDLSFHNWELAFCSLHFAFVVVSSMNLIEEKILSEFDVFIMFLICLTNNLDYRGPVNAFKLQLGAGLENLYTSTGNIVAIHNFCQLINILGLNECNFLNDFTAIIYTNTLELIQKYILNTDIVRNHNLVTEPTTGYNSIFTLKMVPQKIKFLLIGSIIHLAAHSDHLRNFKSSLNAFRLLHQEIRETKSYYYLPGTGLPNIEYYTICELNQNFLKILVKPSLLRLTSLIPDLSHLLDKLHEISVCWRYSCQILETLGEEEDLCQLDVLNMDTFADKVLEIAVFTHEQTEFDKENISLSYEVELEDEELSIDYDTDTSEDEDKQLIAALDKVSTESVLPTDVY
ncbi:cGMP-dependent 3',5'-cyclic phosphodiesterase-like [Onthophagus taurus]|uniref:cGMP-dependent 3',5'-cyclic phosphodiesterase-like n=1 Tax=Onthophagus taurus TaxID=166361 RepID=UPI0039BE4F32